MAKQRKEPSQKQKEYAENIAKALNIKLPEENTSAAYRDFISKNQERFAQSRPVAVHFTDEQINRANAVDIVDYARSMGLELKRDGKDYRVKNYSGGFIISPEKNNWNWFEGDQGGGVVQLCMFLEDKTWQEAVGTLINEDMEPIRRAPDWKPKEEPPKEFNLPPKNNTDRHVYAYLTKTRGIDAEIVRDMLDKGYIYENQYGSCVFVGRDNEGVPRHASVRSTNTTGTAYKKDVSGSQKKYSFSISGTSGILNVFEAPIDALSYMSLQKLYGKQMKDSYVALGGVSDKALERFLTEHTNIEKIRVCTDNDPHLNPVWSAEESFDEEVAERVMKIEKTNMVKEMDDSIMFRTYSDYSRFIEKNPDASVDYVVFPKEQLALSEEGIYSISIREDQIYMLYPFSSNYERSAGREISGRDLYNRHFLKLPAGEKASFIIHEKYGEKYKVIRHRPTHKDFNEDLTAVMQEEIVVVHTHNKTFAEQVDEVMAGTFPFYSSLKVCDTPKILQDIGCEFLPMLYTQKHLKKAVQTVDEKEHQHGLSLEQIKNLPEMIENPAMVMDSPNRSDSIIIVSSDIDSNNNPILVSIRPNGKGRYEVENVESNFITSVYGRNHFDRFVKRVMDEDKLLYCSKSKSQELFERWGEQYSELTSNLDFNKIIHQSKNIVNSKSFVEMADERVQTSEESRKIGSILRKLDAFAKTADEYERFADKDFQENLYQILREHKKVLQDNPDGIVTLQAKFYEESNPNELNEKPDLWNEFWNYLERYGVTGDERFSDRLNRIAAQPETMKQAFSIMKDIKEYLDDRLYMTSYMRGDVAVNEDIASYYLGNAYNYLNTEYETPEKNQDMKNRIQAIQNAFSLDESSTGRFYTANRWGKGENPYFYVTEDLQSSFEAAYASYMASDEDGRVIGYSNAGMSTAHLVELAGYHYADTGRGSHTLNHHLENQMFDEDSKVLADIEKRLYEELKQQNEKEMVVQAENFNNEMSIPVQEESQSERIQVAIESTEDYVDPKIGFTEGAAKGMPAGIKYRIVTYGEDGRLVPYQENPAIYNERAGVEAYLMEHQDRLENIEYDKMVHRAGSKLAEYNMEQTRMVEEGLHSFQFDDEGYLHFSITVNDYDYDGLYRIYAPADGPSREMTINNGRWEPFFERNWYQIKRHLQQYVNDHPLIGEDGKEIPREKASVYCEWSEHGAFEGGKVYSVFEFDRLMEQADTEWIELRRQEREQYGEDAYEELYERNLPQHQTYAKTKYTVFVPGMTELTLRQDIGDGYGSMIDFVIEEGHKHHAEALKYAVLQEKSQELDEVAITVQEESEQEKANKEEDLINDTNEIFVKRRLFVDLDGTCALWQPVAEEELYEQGYYRNLPPYENVVKAVNELAQENSDIEVYVLSKYLTGSKYALHEKEEWVKEHLPNIPIENQIYVPYSKDKKDLIPGGLRETDYLLDDFTNNFDGWQPPAKAVKLLNGINNTKGKWQENKISAFRSPEALKKGLYDIVINGEVIKDLPPQLDNTFDYEAFYDERQGYKYSNFADNHKELLEEKAKRFNNRKTIVINAFGGAGAGKTVSCMDICQQLKKAGYNAEYVSEYCKDLVYENSDMLDGSAKNQFKILQEQMRRVDRLVGQVDFIVTDSPVLLNSVYNEELTPEYEEMVDDIFKQYQNFSFMIQRDETYYQTEGRIHTLEESMEKDNQIREMLQSRDVHFETYNHEEIHEIVESAIQAFETIPNAAGESKNIINQNNVLGEVNEGGRREFPERTTEDGLKQPEPDISISNYESNEPNQVNFDVNIGEDEVHKGEAAFDDDGTVNWIFVDPVPADDGTEATEQQDTAKALKVDWDKIVSRVKELLQDLRYKSREFMHTIGAGNTGRTYTQGAQPERSSEYRHSDQEQQSAAQEAGQNKNSPEQERPASNNTAEESIKETVDSADQNNKNPDNNAEQYKQFADSHKELVSDAVHAFNRINDIDEAATEKQKAYAEKIAETLGITLPEKATKAAYQAFINENQEAFSNSNAPLKAEGADTGSYQDYLEMVTKDGSRLTDVPKEHYTDELLLAAVHSWGAAIRQIPEDRITAEIAMASVQQYGLNLKHVPEKLKNEEICVAAYINSSGKSVRFTPRDIKDRVKEEGQKRLAEDNSTATGAKRQINSGEIQQQGQEWAARIDNILKEHETNPDAIVEDIAFASKFYQYSTRNIQLMRQQNPGITYVAKASAFEKMNYHVKPGEKAMIGRVPEFSRYIINEKGERVYSEKYTPEIKQKLKEGTLKEEQVVKKFNYVAAFYDISQTDCPVEDYPSAFHMGIPSELHQDAFDAMKKFAEENLGFKVMVTDLKSISLRGNCEPDNKIIRINDRLEATMALSTLCHEIAHGIIHTSENSAKMSTAQKECEADVMDIMLESSLGLAINENRRDHLFKSFQTYKEEQAAKEHPYEVTMGKIIDRVQSKVFRTYIDDINIYLDKYLPAEGSRNQEAAKEVVRNLAVLDYSYDMNHEALIDGKNELFDRRKIEDYRELYRKEKDKIRVYGSFMPKLAVFQLSDDGKGYNPDGSDLWDLISVNLLFDETVEMILKHPEQIKPGEQPHVPVGSLAILKENALSEPRIYQATKDEGFKEITEDMKEMYEQVKNRIDSNFYVRNEYLILHDLLENGIELEPHIMKKYDHICKEYGYPKNAVPDSGMRLMARINMITQGLSQNNRDMVAEYVFRTGNYEKAEQYAAKIGREQDVVRKMRQEMRLVDSYKYMLQTIAEYENNNDILEKHRLTTGAYNASGIPVLSENVSSLSQINEKFVLIRKYASPESVKYYSIVEDAEQKDVYRIAYVELNEYEPEVVYSAVTFKGYEEAREFYDQYLGTGNSRLADSSQVKELAALENRENQIALSEITSIGKTIASGKQSYMDSGLDEEAALEMLRMEISKEHPQIKPADAERVQQELQNLKDFKKMVNSYGRERFIELSNLDNLKETDVSLKLGKWLTEQKDTLDKMNITGIDDVKRCVDAALDSSMTASDLEQALNAIDSAVLSAEFSGLETEFEGFEEYNDVLDTLKAAQVTPDKFCYVDFGAEPGPYLYTSDIAGNIYRKSLSGEDGSVQDLNTRLKEAGYEICSSLDDFRAYAANNRLGIFNVPEKEKNEAFIRILESTNDRLPKGQVLSVYDFKDTIDKLSAAADFHDNITYSLVTRKDQEINSYIDTYSGNSDKNVYEQLYEKAQEKVPELSRVISRQYYQDQINSNERYQVKPLLQQLKKENKSVEDSEELGSVMESNARLEKIIKELDLSPADAELLKLNAGNIRTEQSADIQAQQQMNQQTQQRKMRSQQQDGISM